MCFGENSFFAIFSQSLSLSLSLSPYIYIYYIYIYIIGLYIVLDLND